ncbi:PH domain-containing protein [Candidatus Woesearchaeota archaeon]|nr:PH domain-containing protein [Candidatus Woesearchaeota archaeon]
MQYRLLAYAITNHRAIIQSGIIGADYKSIDYDKIQEIKVDVDLLGKIFNTGNIDFKTAGVNVVQTKYGQTVAPGGNVMGCIENPYELAKKIKEISHAP